MRAGDTFKVNGSDDVLVCAGEAGGRVAWCGWPNGDVFATACTLVEACDDAEHLQLMRELAKPRKADPTDGYDCRGAVVHQHIPTCRVCIAGGLIEPLIVAAAERRDAAAGELRHREAHLTQLLDARDA